MPGSTASSNAAASNSDIKMQDVALHAATALTPTDAAR